VVLLLALLLEAGPVMAPAPNLQDILEHMYTRLDKDADRLRKGARWKKLRIDTDITEPANPKVERREDYNVWGDGHAIWQQPIWRNGKDVTDPVEPMEFFMDRELLERFEFSLSEPVRVVCGDRRVCWNLSFVPRTGAIHRSNSIEQRLLDESVGTLLVDEKHYGIVRADALTTKPYTSWKVDVYWFVVAMTQIEVRGTMVTSTVEFSYAYSPLIGRVHTKKRFYEYTKFTLPPH